MFGLEKSLADQLKRLKDEFGLHGIKAEFETRDLLLETWSACVESQPGWTFRFI